MEFFSRISGFVLEHWILLLVVFVLFVVPTLFNCLYKRGGGTVYCRADRSLKVEADGRNSEVVEKILKLGLHHEVVVYYSTDRNRQEGREVSYGVKRDRLHYGQCIVSVPHCHKIGELESPSVWKFEFRENPDKHVVMLEEVELDKSDFYCKINEEEIQDDQPKAFIFIHGYNVTFEDAARRTAQIAFDLRFKGVPIFYSWPSAGNVGSYTVDEQNIEWTESNLKSFLVGLLTETNIKKLYIIAHSMGNRAMVRVIGSVLIEFPHFRDRVCEIILAAPDIDAQVFKEQIAPKLTSVGRPITLYSSSKDLALQASRAVHGHPRAGDSGRDLLVVTGIETVDATEVDTSLMGHSYFSDNRSILSDIFYLTSLGQRAESRFGLLEKLHSDGKYWVFKR